MPHTVMFSGPLGADDFAQMDFMRGIIGPAAGPGPVASADSLYFPPEPADAKFPSPDNNQILATYGADGVLVKITGRAYLKDSAGAVHTIIAQNGKGVYCKNGMPVPGFGEPVAQCLARNGEVYMQITSGVWKHDDPDGTMRNTALPPLAVASPSGTTPGTTPGLTPSPWPVPSAIRPGANKLVLNVGPTRTLKTLTAALAMAQAGDTIQLDPGQTLQETPPAWTVPLLIDLGGNTLKANGMTATLARGKALLCPAADSIIQNGTIVGAALDQPAGQMTSAIRPDEGCGYLTLRNMKLNANQCGVGHGGFPIVISINDSDISNNGLLVNSGALTHNLYVGAECRLLILNNVSAINPTEGHSIKFRGEQLIVNGGTFGSDIGKPFDLPDGATVPFLITNAIISKGTNAPDHGILAFAEESNARGLAGGLILGGAVMANCPNPTIIVAGGTIVVNTALAGNAISASGAGKVIGIS